VFHVKQALRASGYAARAGCRHESPRERIAARYPRRPPVACRSGPRRQIAHRSGLVCEPEAALDLASGLVDGPAGSGRAYSCGIAAALPGTATPNRTRPYAPPHGRRPCPDRQLVNPGRELRQRVRHPARGMATGIDVWVPLADRYRIPPSCGMRVDSKGGRNTPG
jgi:hypothetical protein